MDRFFKCNQLAGHGEMDMEQAIAHSCNCYFIQLAKTDRRPGSEGYGSAVWFLQGRPVGGYPANCTGNLPDAEQLENPAELANFGFGQGF